MFFTLHILRDCLLKSPFAVLDNPSDFFGVLFALLAQVGDHRQRLDLEIADRIDQLLHTLSFDCRAVPGPHRRAFEFAAQFCHIFEPLVRAFLHGFRRSRDLMQSLLTRVDCAEDREDVFIRREERHCPTVDAVFDVMRLLEFRDQRLTDIITDGQILGDILEQLIGAVFLLILLPGDIASQLQSSAFSGIAALETVDGRLSACQ